jgi:hypothetical protein
MTGRLRRLLSFITVSVVITVGTYALLMTPLSVDNAGAGTLSGSIRAP